jgi:hypothetical protein
LDSFLFAGFGFALPLVLSFDKGLQIVQTRHPEHAVLVDPSVDCTERFGIQLVDAMASFTVLTNQVGATQKTQMFRDGRPRDGKGAGDLSGGLAASAEEVKNGSTGGIG